MQMITTEELEKRSQALKLIAEAVSIMNGLNTAPKIREAFEESALGLLDFVNVE